MTASTRMPQARILDKVRRAVHHRLALNVQRWSYLVNIDDWVNLETSDDLKALAEKYCYHLVRYSYFELAPSE
jgi:hypothetical protein